MSGDDLTNEIIRHLIACVEAYSPVERQGLTWFMNEDWFQTCCKMKDSFGHPIWVTTPKLLSEPPYLYGFPVVVTEDAGIPKLEQNT